MTAPTPTTDGGGPRRRPRLATLFVIVLVDLIGFGIIIPLLPFYAERFGASPDTVALLMATYSLAQFVAAPLWGRLSDRIGRRPVLLMSLAGAIFAYIGLAFANSLWVLFAARGVGGFMAGNIAAAVAYVADITRPAERARGMGLVGAAFGLGFIMGPAVGGLLAGPDPMQADYRQPALAAAVMSGAALILAVVWLRESLAAEVRARLAAEPREGRFRQFVAVLGRRNVGILIIINFLATFVFAGMEATFALWSERRFAWGPAQNGYLFAFVGTVGAAVQGAAIGRLVRHLGEPRLVVIGAGALAVGLAMVPFVGGVPGLLAAMVVLVIGFSLTTPSLNSLISLRVGEDEQGKVLGVTRAASALARVMGPAWAGFLFVGLGKDWPFYGGAAVMASVFVLALHVARRGRAETAPPRGTPVDLP